MPQIQIYSAAICPFAQRSRMVLLTKGIEFELTEIDLDNKPDWFSQISPYGKVPVVKHGENRIWESAVINEYLDEVFPEPPLMPESPGKRAIARIWIDFANTRFTTAFYKLLLSQQAEPQQEWAAELKKHLLFLEHEGLRQFSKDGPFWFGDQVSLVDLSYYPWFERWGTIAHYRNLEIPAECERLHQWQAAMENLDAVTATAQSVESHIQNYARYANNSATGVTAQELRQY
jgi:glutathione S-transferase